MPKRRIQRHDYYCDLGKGNNKKFHVSLGQHAEVSFLFMEEHVQASNPTAYVKNELVMIAFNGALNIKRKCQKTPTMNV